MFVYEFGTGAVGISEDGDATEESFGCCDAKTFFGNVSETARFANDVDFFVYIVYLSYEEASGSCDGFEVCFVGSGANEDEVFACLVGEIDEFFDFFDECDEATDIDEIIVGGEYRCLMTELFVNGGILDVISGQVVNFLCTISGVVTVGDDSVVVARESVSFCEFLCYGAKYSSFDAGEFGAVFVTMGVDVLHRTVEVEGGAIGGFGGGRDDVFGDGE